MPGGFTSLNIKNAREDEAGEASPAAALVAEVVAVLGSGGQQVARLARSGGQKRAR